MESVCGLSFDKARRLVKDSFQEVLNEHFKQQFEPKGRSIPWNIIIPSIGLCLLLVLSVFIKPSIVFAGGTITCAILVSLVAVLNLAIVGRYGKAEENEVYAELFQIINQYRHSSQSTGTPRNTDREKSVNAALQYISSGHSHVSIVNTYRNNQWIKVPVLLLAKGDIISLMGGDITPGNVHELHLTSAESLPNPKISAMKPLPPKHVSLADNWVKGKLIRRGKRIHIRQEHLKDPKRDLKGQGNPETKASPVAGDRHRSLAADSVEILQLAGDVRCFVMAETPIEAFVTSVLEDASKSERSYMVDPPMLGPLQSLYMWLCSCFRGFTTTRETVLSENPEAVGEVQARDSLIRQLFTVVSREAPKIALTISCIVLLVVVARLGALQEAREWWVLCLLLPLFTTCLFFTPMTLPLALLLMEAGATADILTTTEVVLNVHYAGCNRPPRQHWSQWVYSFFSPLGAPRAASSIDRQSSTRFRASTINPLTWNLTGKFNAEGDTGKTFNSREDQLELGSDDSRRSEFVDDDIDARADDFGEEISTQVKLRRYWQYLLLVLQKRLLGDSVLSGSSEARDRGFSPYNWFFRRLFNGFQRLFRWALGLIIDDLESVEFLPIPLARTRLIEVLGGITMICFVDDEVICEGYSVAEEIFLLMDNQHGDRPHTGSLKLDGLLSSDLSPGAKSDSAVDPLTPTGESTPSTASVEEDESKKNMKGIVLDLHANPEAAGSRFENPLWWQYLPSLKPLGLNAMMTYTSNETSNSHRTRTYTVESGSSQSSISNLASSYSLNSNGSPPKPRVRKSNSLRKQDFRYSDGSIYGLVPQLLGRGGPSVPASPKLVERELVRHIRHTLPLESLRELAEEIGFQDNDLNGFIPLLEVNVLAPGMENAHLQEDLHQWGQEESRRRGSLLPQLRGSVFRDQNNSLQLMSMGDPSLLLHYCQDYWDGGRGCAITPLSSADRKEVLDVFERWRLEDFDVVAFSYSPVPEPALLPLLQQNVGASPSGNAPGVRSLLPPQRRSGEDKMGSLFFVDPIITSDLPSHEKLKQGKQKRSDTSDPDQPTEKGRDRNVSELQDHEEGEEESGAGQRKVSFENTGDPAPLPKRDRSQSDNMDNEETEKKLQASRIKNNFSRSATNLKDTVTSLSNDPELPTVAEEGAAPGGSFTGGFSLGFISGSRADPTVGTLTKSLSAAASLIGRAASFRSGGSKEESETMAPDDSAPAWDEDGEGESGSSINNQDTTEGVILEEGVGCVDRGLSNSAPLPSDRLSENDATRNVRFSDPPERNFLLEKTLDASKSRSRSSEEPRESDKSDLDAENEEHRALLFRPDGALRKSHSHEGSLTHWGDREDEATSGSGEPLKDGAILGRRSSMPIKSSIGLVVDVEGKSEGGAGKSSPSKRLSTGTDPFSSFREGSPGKLSKGRRAGGHKHSISVGETPFGNGGNSPLAGAGRQQRRTSVRKLWSLLRQQVFLGMAASSVPVRSDVPNAKEDLDEAGIRFVYFSRQNMKRSKQVAEKIGISFDWNCAISLRDLEGPRDPHRYISQYGDWDQFAQLPHGVEQIKWHLEHKDNVPLLVSLYTDATPNTIEQMVEVFRDYGEVVLTVGAGYRAHNRAIFSRSDLATSVSMLPGGPLPSLPANEEDLLRCFPTESYTSLCRADLLLCFRLIGIGTLNMLQAPCIQRNLRGGDCGETDSSRSGVTSTVRDEDSGSDGFHVNPLNHPGEKSSPDAHVKEEVEKSTEMQGLSAVLSETLAPQAVLEHLVGGPAGQSGDAKERTEKMKHLRLSVLLEAVRKGRILQLNSIQALAWLCVASVSLGLWPLMTCLIPISIPPSCPPGIAALFLLVYLPAVALTLLYSPSPPEGVMKSTPRKRILESKEPGLQGKQRKDRLRFCSYLGVRSLYVAVSVFVVTWFAAASCLQRANESFVESLVRFHHVFEHTSADAVDGVSWDNVRAFWLIQDIGSCQALLSILAQSCTLLFRGQTIFELPLSPWRYWDHQSFCHVCVLLLLLHLSVMTVRSILRNCQTYPASGASGGIFSVDCRKVDDLVSYDKLHWTVWFLMFLMPIGGIIVGTLVNRHDLFYYRRHLQFLRLKFDTRLGMHSPR